MSTGKIRIPQSVEVAIQSWFRVAPMMEVIPGVREIHLGKIATSTAGVQLREVSLISYGRKVFVSLRRGSDGRWESFKVDVFEEDDDDFRQFIVDGDIYYEFAIDYEPTWDSELGYFN